MRKLAPQGLEIRETLVSKYEKNSSLHQTDPGLNVFSSLFKLIKRSALSGTQVFGLSKNKKKTIEMKQL